MAIVHLYDGERDRKTRIAKLCTEAGVEEAAVRVLEVQLNMLGKALARACDTAGVSAPLRRRIGAALREELAAVEAQLHGLRFHDLRHTCASLLIAQGAHPKIIQERLGHASITTTMNRYGHLFDGLDATLIDGLDAAHDDAAEPQGNVTELPRPASDEDAAAEG